MRILKVSDVKGEPMSHAEPIILLASNSFSKSYKTLSGELFVHPSHRGVFISNFVESHQHYVNRKW